MNNQLVHIDLCAKPWSQGLIRKLLRHSVSKGEEQTIGDTCLGLRSSLPKCSFERSRVFAGFSHLLALSLLLATWYLTVHRLLSLQESGAMMSPWILIEMSLKAFNVRRNLL